MSRKNEKQWLGKRVRLVGKPHGPVGHVIAAGRAPYFWLVDWPDGHQSAEIERRLEIVLADEAEKLPNEVGHGRSRG